MRGGSHNDSIAYDDATCLITLTKTSGITEMDFDVWVADI